jgi:hypothetical protein
MATRAGIWTYDDHLRHLAGDARGVKGYETTFREALYNPDLWLRTAEAVARWLKHCANNAHTRAVETKH